MEENTSLAAINRITASLPGDEDVARLTNLYAIFADATRVRILFALSAEEVRVSDLCAILSMNKSAVSHQLKLLKLSNLVRFRKDGKSVLYSLADEHVRDILHVAMTHINE
ncbi:MAG: metalloregulator ArsR/SmtB family transcription factor [Oscillospiraceae bacterium]|jgi:ArsR family transcriptional regulator|nr:metalloregulator ArsR/SmtB family transcription factor [Oscillospiraceae bacterium]